MNTLANGIDSVEPDSRAAAVTADIRDRADPALVRADRVEQLYSQLPLGMAATVVAGVIAAWELREGRLIELYQRLGDDEAAVRAARAYLARHPDGLRSSLARKVLAGRAPDEAAR